MADTFNLTVPAAGGELKGIPRWSTEETLRDIKDMLENKFGRSSRDTSSELEKANTTLEKLFDSFSRDSSLRSDEAKAAAATSGQLNRTTLLNNKIMDGLRWVAEKIWDGIKSLTRSLMGLLKKVAIGALTLAAEPFRISALKETFNNLLSSLKDLRVQGLASAGSAAGPSGMGFLDNLRQMGLSLDSSTKILTANSYAVATSRTTWNRTVAKFREITSAGSELGLTLEQSTEFLADEIDLRNRLLQGQQVSEEQRATQAELVLKNQLSYSRLLGISMDDLRKTTRSILSSSSNVQSSLLLLSADSAERSLSALEDFTSSLTGRGFSDDFTRAIVESGTGITAFADESFRNYFTAAQVAGFEFADIVQEMNTRLTDPNGPGLSMEDSATYAVDLQNRMAKIGADGIFQLKVMAQYGDRAAADLLATINKTRQAKKQAEALAKAGGDKPDEVLKDLSLLDSSISAIVENFKLFRQKLQLTLLPIVKTFAKAFADERILTAVGKAGDNISQALIKLFDRLGLNLDEKNLEGLITKLASGIVEISKGLSSAIGWLAEVLAPVFNPGSADAKPFMERLKEFGANMFSSIADGMWSVLTSSTFWKIAVGTAIFARLGSAVSSMGTGLGGIAIMTGAIAALGVSLGSWDKYNWDNVSKGADTLKSMIITIGVLTGAAAAAGAALIRIPMLAGGAGLGIAALLATMWAFSEIIDTFANSLEKLSKINTAQLTGLAGALGTLSLSMADLATSASGGWMDSLRSLLRGDTEFGELVEDMYRLASINTQDLVNNLKILSDIQNGETIKVEYMNAPMALQSPPPYTPLVTPVSGAAAATTPAAAAGGAPAISINYAAETLTRLSKMLSELEKANKKLESLPEEISRKVY